MCNLFGVHAGNSWSEAENWPKLLGTRITFDVVGASRLVFAAETEDIYLQNLAKDLGPHMALPSRDLLTAN